jgi:hypothetical protein
VDTSPPIGGGPGSGCESAWNKGPEKIAPPLERNAREGGAGPYRGSEIRSDRLSNSRSASHTRAIAMDPGVVRAGILDLGSMRIAIHAPWSSRAAAPSKIGIARIPTGPAAASAG